MNDGFVGIGLDLLAQAQDVDVDRSIRHGAVMSPNRVQKLLAAVNHTGAAHQKFEQPELGRGQRHFGPAQRHAAAGPIQLQIPALTVRAGELVVRNWFFTRAISSRMKNGLTM